jgi:tetratricopeptide (TPR) repeat protein
VGRLAIISLAMIRLMGRPAHLTLAPCCRAACGLKLGRPGDAARDCKDVLERDPTNVKALFRLGQALVALKDCEEALRQLQQAAELEPSDKGIAGGWWGLGRVGRGWLAMLARAASAVSPPLRPY